MPPRRAAFSVFLLAFLGALALLICDAAAGLASGLARSLALAATAVLSAVAKIAGLDRLDMLHDSNLRWFLLIDNSLYHSSSQKSIPNKKISIIFIVRQINWDLSVRRIRERSLF